MKKICVLLVILLVIFIYFGVYEINEIINDNDNDANIDNAYIDTNDDQYNNSSPPVKGIEYEDALDSTSYSSCNIR